MSFVNVERSNVAVPKTDGSRKERQVEAKPKKRDSVWHWVGIGGDGGGITLTRVYESSPT